MSLVSLLFSVCIIVGNEDWSQSMRKPANAYAGMVSYLESGGLVSSIAIRVENDHLLTSAVDLFARSKASMTTEIAQLIPEIAE